MMRPKGTEMNEKKGKPRCHTINTLTVEDSVLLRALVDDHVPSGTTAEASLIISRLISNACQRERLLGQFQERLAVTTARALNAENTIRSLRGDDPMVKRSRSENIKRAVDGAVKHERARVVAWLRSPPATQMQHVLADEIENGAHTAPMRHG
jgi:hypothetical protein